MAACTSHYDDFVFDNFTSHLNRPLGMMYCEYEVVKV